MRNYIPSDDGDEPTDFDAYIDYPAETDKDVVARIYIKVERDPESVAHLDGRQNAAIMDMLRWAHEHRSELERRQLADKLETPHLSPDL